MAAEMMETMDAVDTEFSFETANGKPSHTGQVASAPGAELAEVARKMQRIGDELNGRFIERQAEIDALRVGLIARQHAVLIGAPGTAKSAIVTALTKRIEGAELFHTLVSPNTTPDELFGMLSVPALTQGRMEHITDGAIQTAHVAVIEEPFNANTMTLKSLYWLQNERKYRDGGKVHTAPLEMMVGSSNHIPDPDGPLAAAWDRYCLRLVVSPLSDGGHRQFMRDAVARRQAKAQGLDTSGESGTTISLDELHILQQAATQVYFPEMVLEAWWKLRDQLASQHNIRPSDRRAEWLLDLVAAQAVLNGRQVALEDDLAVTKHALWMDETQVRPVAATVMGACNPILGEAQSKADMAAGVATECLSFYNNPNETDRAAKDQKVLEARKVVTQIGKELNQLRERAKGQNRDTKAIEQMLRATKSYWQQVTDLGGDAEWGS